MTAIRSYHGGVPLTLLFRVDEQEQVEALRSFRAAFGQQTDLEPVNEKLFALHIRPGHPGCPCDGEPQEQGR
jgi:hypothetical protein